MDTTKSFTDFSFHDDLQSALTKKNFETCTPIQAEAMPHILSGKDVAGLAQTGTGKTAAFLLPMIERILRSTSEGYADEIPVEEPSPEEVTEPVDSDGPIEAKSASESVDGEAPVEAKAASESVGGEVPVEANAATVVPENPFQERIFERWEKNHFVLVLVPTRELAEQVKDCALDFIKDTDQRCVVVYGGVSIERQIAELEKGVTFLVATPGRLIDLFKNHKVDLKQCRAVIFDEADRMFDMGFKDDMKYILRRIPDNRQLLLFSATLNLDVFNVAYQFGSNPIELNVSIDQATAENVEDFMFHLGSSEKPAHLLALFKKLEPTQVIIFTNYKNNVDRVAEFLNRNGYKAAGISSLINQSQRKRVMDQFRSEGGTNILVATDVAARGLDIKGVDLVINYELPDDAENYVHRIGRTGRAGATGKAYSFVSDKDVEALERITRYIDRKIENEWLETDEIPTEYEAFPRGDLYMNKPRGKTSSSSRRPDSGGRRDSSDKRGSSRKKDDDRPRKHYERKARTTKEEIAKDKENDIKNESAGDKKRRVHRDKARGRHRNDSDGSGNKKRRSNGPGDEASGSQAKKKRSNNRRRRPNTSKKPAVKPGFLGKMGSAIKKLFGS